MNLGTFIVELKRLGVRLRVEDGQLSVRAPKGVITAELGARIRQRQTELSSLLTQAQSASQLESSAIHSMSNGSDFPLSFGQSRLWFLTQLDADRAPQKHVAQSALFKIQICLQFHGALDTGILSHCLEVIFQRHDSLRTVFTADDGEPMQHVRNDLQFQMPLVDLSTHSEEDRASTIASCIREQADMVFDLQVGPLFRGLLIRVAQDEHLLLLAIHHIISDGWSFNVLFKELRTLYGEFGANRPSPLPELPIQYGDYALWQRGERNREILDQHLAYWREQLDGLESLQLPVDHRRSSLQSFNGALRSRLLAPDILARARTLSQREGTTIYMTLLAGFAVFLQRYTGQDDIVVGSPVANRGRKELEGLIGFFVNNLVLRMDLATSRTFSDVLARVRAVALEAYTHQEVPFDKLVEVLLSDRDLSRNPLFQISFSHNGPSLEAFQIGGLEVSILPGEVHTTRFDLECHTVEAADGLLIRFVYNTDLFDASTIERMLSHYERILESVVSDPEIRIDDIDLLSARERAEQLEQWASTQTDYPRNATVAWLFSTQAEATPDAPALAYADRVLSYAELDAASNVVAQRLSAADLDVGAAVGVLLERSAEMVVSWLGVLKAGCAYVPLDADYPVTRLEYMVRDAGVSVVLSDAELPSRLPLEGLTFVDVTSLDGDAEPVEREIGALDAAYIVYTSGSTGEPKGVVVPHRAVVRLVKATDYLQLGPEDRVAQGSNASFDAATFEVWGSLLNGGCLVGVPREVLLDAGRYGAYLQESGVTALFMTTALFNQFSHVLPEAFSKMRAVLFGGEAVDVSAVRRVLAAGGPDRLLHVYGPTESTTFASWHEVAEVSSEALTVPIGKALANTQLYVLGARRELLPVGVEGELYIGGDGLALGYLNQAELTAEKFVASPFAEGERLYRTGDRVRWRSDGQLEFLGRIDGQVKLRGYRIELGEIEHALSAQDGVREALVLCREDTPGDKRLVGYVVSEQGVELQPEVSRSRLKERLPDYMLPSAFVVLDELPLTPNGKVDRAMLPVPEGERQTEQAYVAPRTELEQQIVQIWCEVLNVDQVGLDDNFFDLGGNSLLVMQVRKLFEKALGREVAIVDLFDHATVRALSRHFALQGEAVAVGAGPSSLTKVQERAQHRRTMMHQRIQKN